MWHICRFSPAVLTENLLDVLHVISLLVLDHLEALVGDQLGLLEQLAVVTPCFGDPVTQPSHKLLLTLLVRRAELSVAGIFLDQFLDILKEGK